MHEMSLAEGVLQLIEDSAKTQDFSRVKTVWLEIGQLACGNRGDEVLFRCGSERQHCRGCASWSLVEIPGQAWCLQGVQKCACCKRCLMPVPSAAGHQVQVTGGIRCE